MRFMFCTSRSTGTTRPLGDATARRPRQTDRDILTHLLAEVGNGLLDLNKVHVLHVAQHRDHQALGRCDSHTDVDVVVVHDLLPLDVCMGCGWGKEREKGRESGKRGEGQ
jgi:hypothetical protein